MAKGITVRIEDNIWLEFKKQLLEDGLSAQEFFMKKVLEYLKQESK